MSEITLRDYFEKRLCEADRRIDIKFEAMDTALKLARADVDRRLAELNQLRSEVTSDRGQFVLKDLHFAWKDTVEKRLAAIETRAITWTAAIGLFFIIVSIALRFWPTK